MVVFLHQLLPGCLFLLKISGLIKVLSDKLSSRRWRDQSFRHAASPHMQPGILLRILASSVLLILSFPRPDVGILSLVALVPLFMGLSDACLLYTSPSPRD